MPGDNGFFPPVQYSPLWAILAVLLLVLVAAWLILVPVLTRARPVLTDAQARAAMAPVIRARYVEAIDRIAYAHDREGMSSREAHQRLSALVRAYVHESSGYPASAMTLSELRQLGLPGLTGAVERFYPAEFGATSTNGGVAAAVEDARHVVMDWVLP
ncbi:MAG: hypothetical protein JWQ43_3628 [Glaciihabitans sp.]|nr:hypothetical protein [Glaciihabitans sp.]